MSLDFLINDLAVCAYDVRVAVIEGALGTIVQSLVARRVDSPDSCSWSRYDYGRVHFLRGFISGELLVSWLRDKQGALRGTTFELPVSPHVWVNQVPSNLSYGCITLAVPSIRYTTSLTNSAADRNVEGALLADGCPYFPNIRSAILELLYEYSGSDTASPEPVTIVWPYAEAYFSTISVRPLALVLDIAGALEAPTTLHVYSRQPSFRHMECIKGPSRVVVPLPNGVTGEVHVVLSRGTTLLDRQVIRSSLDNQVDLTDSSSVEALIAHGESAKREFKREFPDHPDKWLKTVVAFANRDGGVLIFGVDPDDGSTVGVPIDPNQFETTVSNQISTRIDPGITPEIHTVPVQGKPLVIVRVPEGVRKPYGLIMKNGDKVSHKYFYRIGSSSFEANPEHIRAAVLQQADSPPLGKRINFG